MRKLDFLFIFLAVLISADYLTSVIGINWLEEQNQYVVAINDLIGNWFITFTLLFIVKLTSLILLYKITTYSKLRQVRRSGVNVAIVLLFVYAIIVVNNAVLIVSANECEVSNHFEKQIISPGPNSITLPDANTLLKTDRFVKKTHSYARDVYFYNYKSVYFYVTCRKPDGSTYDATGYYNRYGGYQVFSTTVDGHEYKIVFSIYANGEYLYITKTLYKDGEVAYPNTYQVWKEIPVGTVFSIVEREIHPVDPCSDVVEYNIETSSSFNWRNPYYNDALATDEYFLAMGGGFTIPGQSKLSAWLVPKDTDISLNFQYINSYYADITYGFEGYFYTNITNVSEPTSLKLLNYFNTSEVLYSDDSTSGGEFAAAKPFIIHIFGTDVDYNDELAQVCPVVSDLLNETTANGTVSPTEVKFYFFDIKTNALLDSVNFNISGDDFSDSGVYDYFVTYTSDQLTQGNTYSYTAERTGYKPVSGNFMFTGGQIIKLYFVPDLTNPNATEHVSDPVNNTALTFTVLDSETKEPVEGATVTLESYSKLTNENGFTWFEVQKNGIYRYRVSKEGYYSISGTVNVGENQIDVTVELIPTSAIPTTTPAGGGDTGGTTGGSTGGGGTGEDGGVDTTASAIDTLKANAQTLVSLCILVTIIALFNKAMPRRRR